jgi:hypothetical protein
LIAFVFATHTATEVVGQDLRYRSRQYAENVDQDVFGLGLHFTKMSTANNTNDKPVTPRARAGVTILLSKGAFALAAIAISRSRALFLSARIALNLSCSSCLILASASGSFVNCFHHGIYFILDAKLFRKRTNCHTSQRAPKRSSDTGREALNHSNKIIHFLLR